MEDVDDIRRRAHELGESAFNAVSEDDVRALRDRAFPEIATGVLEPGTIPAGAASGLLTMCRLALSTRLMAATLGSSPLVLWAFIKMTTLDDLVAKELATDRDKAEWAVFEHRLMAAAFAEQVETHE
jgi:hypothetical protein